MNKVILMGRLGGDVDLKYTTNGNAVANFTVATSEKWKDDSGEQKEKTEWSRVVVWGKLAELCSQYLSKGKQVFLEGKLETRSWEKDGQKHYSTEIIASSVQFVGSKEP
jgi:single-strand DNA-binding protein